MKKESKAAKALRMTAIHLGSQLGMAIRDCDRQPSFELYKGTRLGAHMALRAFFHAARYGEVNIKPLALAARITFLEETLSQTH